MIRHRGFNRAMTPANPQRTRSGRRPPANSQWTDSGTFSGTLRRQTLIYAPRNPGAIGDRHPRQQSAGTGLGLYPFAQFFERVRPDAKAGGRKAPRLRRAGRWPRSCNSPRPAGSPAPLCHWPPYATLDSRDATLGCTAEESRNRCNSRQIIPNPVETSWNSPAAMCRRIDGPGLRLETKGVDRRDAHMPGECLSCGSGTASDQGC